MQNPEQELEPIAIKIFNINIINTINIKIITNILAVYLYFKSSYFLVILNKINIITIDIIIAII